MAMKNRFTKQYLTCSLISSYCSRSSTVACSQYRSSFPTLFPRPGKPHICVTRTPGGASAAISGPSTNSRPFKGLGRIGRLDSDFSTLVSSGMIDL
jgi:hypothetical protein